MIHTKYTKQRLTDPTAHVYRRQPAVGAADTALCKPAVGTNVVNAL